MESPLASKLRQALGHHQHGQLAQARALYESILETEPRHAPALHFSGVVAAQTGNLLRAVELFERAAEIDPDAPGVHCNRASALRQLGRWEAALAACSLAIALKPDFAEAYCIRGDAQRDLGRPEAALASYDQALALKPELAQAHSNRGMVLRELGRMEAALLSYDRAIELNPEFAEAFSNRADVLKELKQYEAALASCDRAILLNADLADAWCNRGNVLRELKRWGEALASCDRALELKPGFPEAHCNRGIVLRALGRFEEALASYDHAIALKADYADAYANRGIVLKELGQFDAALASCNRAIALEPEDAGAHATRAVLFHETNRIGDALGDYDRAIGLKPAFAEARINRSMALLLAGELEKGWVDFEWRWHDDESGAIAGGPFAHKLWLGREPVEGKRMLLRSEQGLGDTLQFCRFAKKVAGLGASVILEVQRPLTTLLAGLEGVDRIVVQGDTPPEFDFQCPLMSLPLAFQTTLSSIPADIPYLRSCEEKSLYWREKLGNGQQRLRVGLVWSGGFRHDQPELWAVNKRRNIPLVKLAALKHPDVEFYSLQKGQPAESELSDAISGGWNGPPIADHTSLLHDFSDTAALIENLDLVISVDTSTAHLAAAMGKPVWILNRFDTCWRWLLDRTDSPWYPTVRLYRQERREDWDSVVGNIRRDLALLAAGAHGLPGHRE